MSQDMEIERLRALVTAASTPSTCPPAEQLARAAAGELCRAARDAVADHMASCASCSDEYRTAVALGPWARRAATEIAAPESTSGRLPLRSLALAASILLALSVAGALTWWGLSLRDENERLTAALRARTGESAESSADAGARDKAQATAMADLQARLTASLTPELNVPIIDLLPPDALRGNAAAALPRIPAGAAQVTFVITPPQRAESRDHELEIVDATGTVRWRGAGLLPNVDRVFTATVPRTMLSAGTCRVRLYVTRDTGPRLIAEYSVHVD